MTRHDALDEIAGIGPPAIHPVLDLVEAMGPAQEFEERGSPGWHEHGAFTPQATAAHGLILGLAKVAPPDARARARVVALLDRMVGENRARPLSGLGPPLLARTLATWLPDVHPPAETSPSTNHLLNADAFLSTP